MTERKCPICGRPAEADHRPFCSRRCADLDLQRWFSGAYAVPGPQSEADEDSVADSDPYEE
ncbi:MAG: DNA gyrase inhibitor YacG [Caulobacteraceae bacterium]